MVSLAIILVTLFLSVLFDRAVGNSKPKSFKQIQKIETRLRKREKRKLLKHLEKELRAIRRHKMVGETVQCTKMI